MNPPELPVGNWYNQQNDAVSEMERVGDKILVKWDSYNFTSFVDQDEFMDFITECKESDRQFFEVLTADKPQLMFADIDGEGLAITREQLYIEWEILMKKVFVSCGLKFDSSRVRLLNSTGDKISGHWSYIGLSFKSCVEQKAFWLYVDSVIESEHPNLCFMRKRVDEKLELMNVLDIGVYSRNRAMRTIYSHKAGSDRILMPIRMKNNKIMKIKNCDPLDYLIYSPDATEFYDVVIPKYGTLKRKLYTQDNIQKMILEFVPNVEISEISGRIFKLRNVGIRVCIINSEENLSDNSFVIWKRDGLYFGCHDSECSGQLKKLCAVGPYVSVSTNCFDFSDPYDWCKFHKEFNGKNHDEEINSVMEKYPRVIAHILEGEGSYIKKMENGQVSVVKGLKSSDVKFRSKDGPISMTYIISFLPNSFSKISCKLTNCPENEFNLWSGFQAVRVVEQKSEGLELMKSFIFEVWASSNQIHYDYIISWLAGLVTNLSGINRVALLMVSEQGTGKNTLGDFMKLILRPCNVATVEGIEGVVGRFNTQVQNKRLIVMNELCSTREEFRNNFDKIKPIISDATITIEPKGVNKYELDNIANLIAFTNHKDAVSLEESDRRWATFEMCNIYRNNSEYFDRIRDICFTQDIANQFYTYLLDFPAVNLSKIPMTDLKHNMINISKPSPLKFLDAINEDVDLKEAILDGETRVKATLLYSKYREWCVENGERNIITSTKFGTIIGSKLRKVHTRNGNMYELL